MPPPVPCWLGADEADWPRDGTPGSSGKPRIAHLMHDGSKHQEAEIE